MSTEPKSSDSGVSPSVRCSARHWILTAFMMKPNTMYVACQILATGASPLPLTCSVLEGTPHPYPTAERHQLRACHQYPLAQFLSPFFFTGLVTTVTTHLQKSKKKKKRERKSMFHPFISSTCQSSCHIARIELIFVE